MRFSADFSIRFQAGFNWTIGFLQALLAQMVLLDPVLLYCLWVFSKNVQYTAGTL